jgi:hypothetical protein
MAVLERRRERLFSRLREQLQRRAQVVVREVAVGIDGGAHAADQAAGGAFIPQIPAVSDLLSTLRMSCSEPHPRRAGGRTRTTSLPFA